jgi:hypothetical protein
MNENMKAHPARGLVKRKGAPKGQDTVPAYLSTGEYVLPKATVDAMGGPEALDKLVSTTNGRAPGGKPVERSTKPFAGGLRGGMPAGFNSGGLTSPMADAQADHQKWLEMGAATGENVDPSVYGFANGGAVRKMKNIDPNAVQPAPEVGRYWSDSNAAFEAGNPGVLDRFGRAIWPTTGLGSALGAMHDAASQGDVPGMALSAATAVPAFGIARLTAIPGKGLVKSTQAMMPSAKHTGAAVAGNAAFGAAADTYVPGQENGTAQPVAQRQNVALPNTTAQDQRRYAKEVLGFANGGAVRKVAGYASGGSVGDDDETPIPTSGSYDAQREYARQTGAMNIPPPAPTVALPNSSTLAPGSAAWAKSLAAEKQAQMAEQQQAAQAPIAQPGARPTAPAASGLTPSANRAGARQAVSEYNAADPDTAEASLMAKGFQSRDVQNAPGVKRLTGKDGRTIYTNDVADTAQWVAGGMKPGMNTISAENMRNPAATASGIVGPALRDAAARGDFRAVRNHYQKGGGTFNGETANQSALRMAQQPSGNVSIRDGGADKEANRRMGLRVQELVNKGDIKGARVMKDLLERQQTDQESLRSNTLARQQDANDVRTASIDGMRRAEETAATAPLERETKQVGLDRDKRRATLEDRAINGKTASERQQALEALRALSGAREPKQDTTVEKARMDMVGSLYKTYNEQLAMLGKGETMPPFEQWAAPALQMAGQQGASSAAAGPTYEQYAQQIRSNPKNKGITEEVIARGYQERFGG